MATAPYVRVPDMEPLRSAILEAVDSEGHLFDEVMEYRRILEPAVAELGRAPPHPRAARPLEDLACDQQRRILIDGDDGELDANSTLPSGVFGQQIAHQYRGSVERAVHRRSDRGLTRRIVAPVLSRFPSAHH